MRLPLRPSRRTCHMHMLTEHGGAGSPGVVDGHVARCAPAAPWVSANLPTTSPPPHATRTRCCWPSVRPLAPSPPSNTPRGGGFGWRDSPAGMRTLTFRPGCTFLAHASLRRCCCVGCYLYKTTARVIPDNRGDALKGPNFFLSQVMVLGGGIRGLTSQPPEMRYL